jgi:uncharacterized protein (TIRG00374 family)
VNGAEENRGPDFGKRLFRLNTLFALAAVSITIYVFLTQFDIGEAGTIIRDSNVLLLLCGTLVFFGSLPLRGYRWQKLLLQANVSRPSWELSRLYFLSWFVNSVLPGRVGDIYRAYLLKKNGGVRISLSLGVLFSERVFDLATIASLVAVCGALYLRTVTDPELNTLLMRGLCLIAVAVSAFAVFAWRSGWLQRFLPRRWQEVYGSFSKGIFRSPSMIPAIAGQSLLIWLSEAGRLLFVARALGCELDFFLAVFASQAALVVMSLPLTPAGLGVVELVMFSILIPAGISREAAAAVVIADRLISYWLLIILGGIHFLVSGRYR